MAGASQPNERHTCLWAQDMAGAQLACEGRTDSALTTNTMLLAQALGEYGALATVIQAMHQAWIAAGDYARSFDNTTWAGALFGAFLVWSALSRRR